MNMKPNKLLLSVLVAGSLLATNASALLVTLDPTAANLGAPTGFPGPGAPCAGTACVLSSTTPAFQASQAKDVFGSLLTIGSLTGSATANVGFHETGYFQITGYDLLPQSTTGLGTKYNVFGTFDLTGVGGFNSTNTFTASSVSAFTSTIYGVPGGASGLAFTTPTSGNPTGVTNPGTGVFKLGSAAYFGGPASATAIDFGGGVGFTVLVAPLLFNAYNGVGGPGTYWKDPNPFIITLATAQTGNLPQGGIGTFVTANGTLGCPVGSTCFTTTVATDGTGSGAGTINFGAVVPEPGSVALIGLALALVGFVRYRPSSGMAGA